MVDEPEDFFARKAQVIAEDLRPKPLKHRCRYPPGKRIWVFTWRWPFVRSWRSRAICLCDIVEILDSMPD